MTRGVGVTPTVSSEAVSVGVTCLPGGVTFTSCLTAQENTADMCN